MRLIKYEQSGFLLETDNGFKLAVDIGSYTPVHKLDGLQADAMLISHIHGDHFSLDHIKKFAPKKLYLGEECVEALGDEKLSSEIIELKDGDIVMIDDIKVRAFQVDHGTNITKIPRQNFGFLIEVDGQKIYFAGDMFNPSGIDVSNLEVDTALIPVGTFYTFGPQEALDFIKRFKKIGRVISMHYEKKPETKKEFIDLVIQAGFNTESYSI